MLTKEFISVQGIPIEDNTTPVIMNVSIPLLDGSSQRFQVKLYDLGLSKQNFPEPLKGTNKPTLDDVQNSYVFGLKNETECDISMVIGHFEGSQESLLLNMRFYKKIEIAEQFGKQFFNFARTNMNVGRGFLEVWRKGGSSGLVSPSCDSDFFRFMNVHAASSPLKTTGIKIIRNKLVYVCFYISPYQKWRKVVPVTYSRPRMGGSFPLSDDHFGKFDFLETFAEHKINAARIVNEINCSYLFAHRPISKMAVTQELHNIKQCIGNYGIDKKKDILRLYNSYNSHTIVCHNVGYHQDNFGKHSASFENKCVFMVDDKTRLDSNIGWNYSRGGGTHNGQFCYALLDWGSGSATRRDACITHGIIEEDAHVNIRNIREYFRNNPNAVQVASEVGFDLRTQKYVE